VGAAEEKKDADPKDASENIKLPQKIYLNEEQSKKVTPTKLGVWIVTNFLCHKFWGKLERLGN
jgi:hypothetical protein